MQLVYPQKHQSFITSKFELAVIDVCISRYKILSNFIFKLWWDRLLLDWDRLATKLYAMI